MQNILNPLQGRKLRVLVFSMSWEQAHLSSIIQKRHLLLFGHLAGMDESADAGRILTAVPHSDCGKGRQGIHTLFGWLDEERYLSYHNLSVEDATELALDRPLWRLLAASGATHCASQTMMMMIMLMLICPIVHSCSEHQYHFVMSSV